MQLKQAQIYQQSKTMIFFHFDSIKNAFHIKYTNFILVLNVQSIAGLFNLNGACDCVS